MPARIKDTALASNFTTTQHSKPIAALKPQNNKLPTRLNVLVIGASKGIGAGIAYAYAQAGAANLILAARSSSSEDLRDVKRKVTALSPSTQTIQLHVDITSWDSVECLAKDVKDKIGTLDVVVLNSGYSGPVVLNMDEGDPQDFQDVFNVNVTGTYNVAHYFIPLLKGSGGAKTLIVVNSFASLITSGHIANTAYCVSKMAQARLVEFLAEQYGADGVLSIAVHPGAVNTEMADKTTPESFRSCEWCFTTIRCSRLILIDLTDDIGLCGAFCVWLNQEKRMWLNGRLVSAKWDVDELLQKQSSIEEQDLLKFGFRVGN
jgi:NAD(P)-dependent dehydrogenase (short-subunit alcohol dehydrogenase family)